MSFDQFSNRPLGSTAVRPSWEQLPHELRDFVTVHLGSAIIRADVQSGGFTPGVAARLILTNGRVFIKAIPNDHVLAAKYRTEAETAGHLPGNTPSPRLRWHGTAAGWVILIFDDIDGRHPDLTPGSPDIFTVASALSDMAALLTPNPLPHLPLASISRARLLHGWGDLATSPPHDLGGWEQRHLQALTDLETLWVRHADGTTLVHGDIRPDNLLITSDATAAVVDWAQPCQGAAWQDIADLIPHMIMAGHSPQTAEKALIGLSVWDLAEPDVITSYAAAFAGYWTRMSRQSAPPGVPHLRSYQRRAAAAAITWTMYRTGW
ncbi:aminoglycoside phosphotransferase family protein [Streptosporangium sp. CA-135522]|uniref:aminoglycoside phosphotransferase family protein n=1 Tax=Streptosporangium sp. CA-135522 TaxID=3240072 RepID=UPI003D9390F5